ncbi:predicted protein [Nematostella vectensis]|uniref:Uncharacterized protein n=1 Tax=Nematostella vectensis TaxID=45351 RepID=A7RPI9_NEMVE|nr:predicted protein [Nematostella vectensis]|eukprot:XP_001638641.1 predicted protein [Nematostella vectensis]
MKFAVLCLALLAVLPAVCLVIMYSPLDPPLAHSLELLEICFQTRKQCVSAYSIKCYVCTDEKANCNKNEVDCSVAGESYKYCLKVKTGDAVTKSCAKQTQCDTFKSTCDKSDGKCVAACCNDKDLCNSGLTTKPMMLISLLMPILLLVRSM